MSEGETTLRAIDAEAKYQSVHGRRCGQAHRATHGEPESFSFRNEGVPSSILRSIGSPLYAVLPLQGGDLGAITGGAQIGTFGGTRGRALGGVEGPAWRARPPGEHGGHRDHEQKPHQGTAPGMAHQSSEDFEHLLREYHRVPLHAAPVGTRHKPPCVVCPRHACLACPCRPRRPGVTGAVADKTTGRAHPLFLRPHSVDRFWTERLINPWCS